MRKIAFSVHPLAAAGLLFIVLMPAPKSAMFLISTLAHELSHIAAAAMFKLKIRSVTLAPFGVSVGLAAPRSYVEEIAVASAGPVMNFLICAVIKAGIFPVGAGTDDLFLFSLTFGALNVLPIRTLDGGTIFYALTSLVFGRDAAKRALDITSAAFISLIWLCGIYIFFYGGENFTLLAFSSCLFVYAMMKSGEKKNNT